MTDKNKTETTSKRGQKLHICDICNATIIGGQYKLKAHLYQHDLVKPRFQCSHCPKCFFRRDLYRNHMNTHNGTVATRRKYGCDYCGRTFVCKRSLIIHLRIHDVHLETNLHLKYDCKACNASYSEARLLKYHIRKTHFNLDPTISALDTKIPNETWVERVNGSKSYVEMTRVNNNVIKIKPCTKTDDKVAVSKKNSNSEYMSSVFASENTHYSRAICDYCKKEMLKKSLPMHIKDRHLKIRNFKCEDCCSSFKRHYQLVNHTCPPLRRKRCVKKEV